MNTFNSRSKKNLNVTTIWNGTTWSSGTPSTYKIARIQGTYSTLTNGGFSCLDMYLDSNKITIQHLVILQLQVFIYMIMKQEHHKI